MFKVTCRPSARTSYLLSEDIRSLSGAVVMDHISGGTSSATHPVSTRDPGFHGQAVSRERVLTASR